MRAARAACAPLSIRDAFDAVLRLRLVYGLSTVCLINRSRKGALGILALDRLTRRMLRGVSDVCHRLPHPGAGDRREMVDRSVLSSVMQARFAPGKKRKSSLSAVSH